MGSAYYLPISGMPLFCCVRMFWFVCACVCLCSLCSSHHSFFIAQPVLSLSLSLCLSRYLCFVSFCFCRRRSLPTVECKHPQHAVHNARAILDYLQNVCVRYGISMDRKHHWLPDSTCSRCVACQTSFSLTTRRHHCRLCGRFPVRIVRAGAVWVD
jgi:FYVE zinc finger